MKAKSLLPLCLAAVLLVSVVVIAGCGSKAVAAPTQEAKTKLSTALNAFDMSAGAITTAFASGKDGTVAATIKAAKADIKAKWDAVVDAAQAFTWADKDLAGSTWSTVAKAIDSLPDNASVADAKATLTGPVDGLMGLEAELWSLAEGTK